MTKEELLAKKKAAEETKKQNEDYINDLYAEQLKQINTGLQENINSGEVNSRANAARANEYYAQRGLAGNINANPISGASVTSRTNLEMARQKNITDLQNTAAQNRTNVDLAKQKLLIDLNSEYNNNINSIDEAYQSYLASLPTYSTVQQTQTLPSTSTVNPNTSGTLAGSSRQVVSVLPSGRISTLNIPSAERRYVSSPLLSSGREDILPSYTPTVSSNYTSTLPSAVTQTQASTARPAITSDNQVYPAKNALTWNIDDLNPNASYAEATWGVPSGLTYRGKWDKSLIADKLKSIRDVTEKQKIARDFYFIASQIAQGKTGFSNFNITIADVESAMKSAGLV